MRTIGRIIVRETAVTERGRPLLVELHPGFVVLRLKGLRQRWSIAYGSMFWVAVKTAVEEQRACGPKRKPRQC